MIVFPSHSKLNFFLFLHKVRSVRRLLRVEGDRDGQELRERENVSGEKVRRQHGARRRSPHRHPHPQGRIRRTGKTFLRTFLFDQFHKFD
jgi:hypothetical protein